MFPKRLAAALLAAICVLATAGTATSSLATMVPDGPLVATKPVYQTPDLLDGKVTSVTEVGTQMILAGTFTQVKERSTGAIYDRAGIVAFNKSTGRISQTFKPSFSGGLVNVVLAAPDGTSVFVGGGFSSLDGTSASRLVKLSATTGQRVAGFTANLAAGVQDLDSYGNRLFVVGHFYKVNAVTSNFLAELDPTTGKPQAGASQSITGTHHGAGVTYVNNVDVAVDGSSLLISGNFNTVNGALHSQIAVFSVQATSLTLTSWRAPVFEQNSCNQGYAYYIQDAQFSPDATYFVTVTTGAYGNGTNGACDSAMRWNVDPNNTNAAPYWAEYSGGDSFTQVEVTEHAAYVGGHFRWLNNPFAADRKSFGAVDYRGMAALDPVNGTPLTNWIPMHPLKLGVYDLYANEQGLYVGSDYPVVSGQTRSRIALFPYSASTPSQATEVSLPTEVYRAAGGVGQPQLSSGSFNDSSAEAPTALPDPGIDWSTVRAAWTADGVLYTAQTDGTLLRRSYDGSTFGTPSGVDLHNLPAFTTSLSRMTGAFLTNGRLYYTVTGSNLLYMRYFTAYDDLVGAQEFTLSTTASGVDFSKIAQMFYASDAVYTVHSTTGVLTRSPFTAGSLSGPSQPVSGPGIDNVWWKAPVLFSGPAQP